MARPRNSAHETGGPPHLSSLKQTDVGILPTDWDVRALGEIGESLIGLTYDPKNIDPTGVLVLRSSNIGGNSLQFEDDIFVAMEIPDRIVVREDDLLICVRNGSRPLIGKCALIDRRAVGMTFGAFMSVFRSDDNEFVFHCFQSANIKRQIHQHLGATINQITNRSLNSFQIPYPEVTERKAISEALTDVDNLIAGLETVIAKKRAIKHAAMQQLLTGQTRLPGFAGGWETRRLEQVTNCLDHVRIPLNESERLSMPGPYPYCGANGVLDYVGDFVLDDDVILIAEDGGYFDEYTQRPIAYRMSGKIWVNNHAHILKAKSGYSQGFIYFSLVHKNLLSYLAGGTRAKLNRSEMNKVEVYLPIDNAEQGAIATVLSDIDIDINSLEQRRDKTRAIKEGMMQDLLTGRVRLVQPNGTTEAE